MEHKGTQRIESTRLILRPLLPKDAGTMYRNWASDPEVVKFLMWLPHKDIQVSRDILAVWVRDYGRMDAYQWAITLREKEAESIGCIGVVNQIDAVIQAAHIGYCIVSESNDGIKASLLRHWAVSYAIYLTRLAFVRIESRFDPRNVNSGAVMKKCGMKYERTLRQSDWNNQGICDASYYAVFADEC